MVPRAAADFVRELKNRQIDECAETPTMKTSLFLKSHDGLMRGGPSLGIILWIICIHRTSEQAIKKSTLV